MDVATVTLEFSRLNTFTKTEEFRVFGQDESMEAAMEEMLQTWKHTVHGDIVHQH